MPTREPTLTLGNYRLVEELGRGGMGVVYRAEHVETGEPCAIKTVRVPDEGMLQSLRREIHALSRVTHPGVVRILGWGTEGGLPWYAMELIDGRPLRAHLARAVVRRHADEDPGLTTTQKVKLTSAHLSAAEVAELTRPQHPTTPSTDEAPAAATAAAPGGPRTRPPPPLTARGLHGILTVLRRVCTPLAYLHGEGIVHRDLKPGNIVIRTGSEQPVLVDFGLVARFGGPLSREVLEVSAVSMGTIDYMAPEQIRGELVDARADLYALGCVLYEMLCGSPPFRGGSGADVARAHLRVEPTPPSQVTGGIPPEVDELLARLLAKDPHERLGYAAELEQALADLGAANGVFPAAPVPRPYLYRPGFAGRRLALAQLEQQVARLGDGAGGLVVIGGESGVGKTRLAIEAARSAARSEVRVLAGECRPAGLEGAGILPLHAWKPILEAVADHCRQHGPEEAERVLGRRAGVLAHHAPALGDLPGLEHHPPPERLPSFAALLRLYNYLTRTLVAWAERRPLLAVLDDLQWADELTLGHLDFLVQGDLLANAPLLLLCTCRAEETTPALEELLAHPSVTRLDLGRLETEDVSAIAGDMLALPDVPEELGQFLARESEGNPFFAAEYLRAAVEEGYLCREAATGWRVELGSDDLRIPRSLLDLVERRLQGLPAVALEVTRAAAVVGREVPVAVLEHMVAVPEQELLGAVGELVRRQVLEDAGGGRLRFTHDKIREATHQALADEALRDWHRRAALALEDVAAAELDLHLAALGQHWELGGDEARAREYYARGASRAVEQDARVEAERLIRAFLRLAREPGPKRVDAHMLLGRECLHMRGDNEGALAAYRTAIAEAEELGARELLARGWGGVANLLSMTGQLEEAQAASDQALALFREAGDRLNEGRILSDRAVLEQLQGDRAGGEGLLEEALAIFQSAGADRAVGIALGNLATHLQDTGRLDEAQRLSEKAVQLNRQHGPRTAEAGNLCNLAQLHRIRGRAAEAWRCLEEARRIMRETGDVRGEAFVLNTMATDLKERGELSQAEQLQREVLQIRSEIADRRGLGVTGNGLAEVLILQGRLPEARAAAREALRILVELQDSRFASVVRVTLATVLRLQGEYDEALALLESARVWQEDNHLRLDLLATLLELGHVTLARGGDARPYLDEARALGARVGMPPGSDLGQALARLERAAFAGEPLVHGQCPDDLPPPP
jgi:serine/threonine protein kinase